MYKYIYTHTYNEIITKCNTVIGFSSYRIYFSVEFTIHQYIMIDYLLYVYELLL